MQTRTVTTIENPNHQITLQKRLLQQGRVTNGTLILLIALFLTGVFSGIIIASKLSDLDNKSDAITEQKIPSETSDDQPSALNPFIAISKQEPTTDISETLAKLNKQIEQLTTRIDNLEEKLDTDPPTQPVSSRKLRTPYFSTTLPVNLQMYTKERLVNGGVDEALADEIIRKQNENELKRLELQDKAKREGYFMTERYENELAQIEGDTVSLRDELGEDEYDRFLFNSKLNNRVKVTSVIQGSAAEQAGIQANDIVLTYDGKRMFKWNELKTATAEGRRGEPVTIDIIRDGELFSLTIPRGPLGIRLGATRVEP